MSGRSTFSRVVLVCLMGLGLAVVGGEFEPATGQSSFPYQWSVKYVCGWLPPAPPQEDQFAKPGDYATVINILNPTSNVLRIEGLARPTVSYRSKFVPGPTFAPVAVTALRFRTLIIDCPVIWSALGLPSGTFVEGFIHVGLPNRVQVSAVYTSQTHNNPVAGPDAGAGHSIDVENIEPFVSP